MTVIFTLKQPITSELICDSSQINFLQRSLFFYRSIEVISLHVRVSIGHPERDAIALPWTKCHFSPLQAESSNGYYTFPSFHIPNKENGAKYDASLYLIAL